MSEGAGKRERERNRCTAKLYAGDFVWDTNTRETESACVTERERAYETMRSQRASDTVNLPKDPYRSLSKTSRCRANGRGTDHQEDPRLGGRVRGG